MGLENGGKTTATQNAVAMSRNISFLAIFQTYSVVDPGFRPPTQVFFSENVCENGIIGSHRRRAPGTPQRSVNATSLQVGPR